MAQSSRKKKITNMVYGLGAAIVIIGALFKIQHISIGPITGGVMLTIGLLVEAGIFAMSAFESGEEELDWSKVYPELKDADAEPSSETGMLSKKIDKLLQEAGLDSELVTELSKSIKDLSGVAKGFSAVGESVAATNNYSDQVSLAATHMESLNGLYQIQMESANKQAALNNSVFESSEKLKEQMQSLSSNLSSLNGVYGGMLSAMSKN
jgi:gliding motility-associated protein GldL